MSSFSSNNYYNNENKISKNKNSTEIPMELYYDKNDLDKIRKRYVKKAPYHGKQSVTPETKISEIGSSKRNIQRSGAGNKLNSIKIGKKLEQKNVINKSLDDGSTYDHYDEENDPNYDSEVIIIIILHLL